IDPQQVGDVGVEAAIEAEPLRGGPRPRDRKSTRLNSSHVAISYAVFCLKKKRRRWITQALGSKHTIRSRPTRWRTFRFCAPRDRRTCGTTLGNLTSLQRVLSANQSACCF